MVSVIRDLIREGVAVEQAIAREALLSLRPILMIGLAASLATVVISGIISATVLSLLVLPALDRLTTRPDCRPEAPEEQPSPAPQPMELMA